MGNGRFKPGQVANPLGRPLGSLNKKTLVCKALDEAAEDVTKAVIEQAKGGDMQAARLVLDRIKPPLRPRAERVQFPLDPDAPLTTQARQLMDSIASGAVDPETGKMLIDCLHGFASLRQADELAARIEALETAAGAQGGGHYPGHIKRT